MNVLTSSGLLNLAAFQQKMDEIVFENIDTKPNWEKAFIGLDELLEQTTKFFVTYVKNKEYQLPKNSSYWVLFMELNAKLIYFTTLALKNYDKKSIGITNEVLARRFEIASKCITNVNTEENEQFLVEIKDTFDTVSSTEDYEGLKERKVEDCIQTFYEFAKQY